MVSTVGLMGQAGDDAWKVVAQHWRESLLWRNLANGCYRHRFIGGSTGKRCGFKRGIWPITSEGRVSNILKASTTSIWTSTSMDGALGQMTFRPIPKRWTWKKRHSWWTRFSMEIRQRLVLLWWPLGTSPIHYMNTLTITANKDITITPWVWLRRRFISPMCNMYAEIDRPHALIRLLTSVANSPSGKLLKWRPATRLFFEEGPWQRASCCTRGLGLQYALSQIHQDIKKSEQYTFR